jgi:hypothetical protein
MGTQLPLHWTAKEEPAEPGVIEVKSEPEPEPVVEIPRKSREESIPWEDRPTLWTQETKIPCPKCGQDTLQSCYRDQLCFNLVKQIEDRKPVSWELHYHWYDHKPYSVYLRYQTKNGATINTVMTGALPEHVFEECLTTLKNRGKEVDAVA